jgi:hypothetical protein
VITRVLLHSDGTRTVYHRTDEGQRAWEHADEPAARNACEVCGRLLSR